jgi:Zn-finger nucleic acid-binding protein
MLRVAAGRSHLTGLRPRQWPVKFADLSVAFRSAPRPRSTVGRERRADQTHPQECRRGALRIQLGSAMQGINDHIGYDVEDGVFKEIEAKQLAALRAKLDERRRQEERNAARAAHWMCCPKCGGEMKEETFENVRIDKCTQCHSVNLNADEIELLIQYERDHASLWHRIFHHRHTSPSNRRAA